MRVSLYRFKKKAKIAAMMRMRMTFITQKTKGSSDVIPLCKFIPKMFVTYVPTARAIMTIARVVSAMSNSLRKESKRKDICKKKKK